MQEPDILQKQQQQQQGDWKPVLSQYLQFVYFIPAVKTYFQQSDYSCLSHSASFTNKG